MIFSSPVPPSVKKGTSIVDYCATRFTYFDRDRWRRTIQAGKISANGSVIGESATIGPGDSIAYDAGEFEEPAADLGYSIVYEDEWLLGINKPGNLLVHRAGKSFRNNLIYQLRYVHHPCYPGAHTAHRLDRDTSGVVLVAKTAETMAALGRGIAAGAVRKIYRAVVLGVPAPQLIDLPIGKKPSAAISYKFGVDPEGKAAQTEIIDCEKVGSHHALVTVRPITGRTHQIRIHLAAIGAPVVGDKLYCLSEEAYCAWRKDPDAAALCLPFHRHALHCASLTFMHPVTGNECRVEAEIPQDMIGLLKELSKQSQISG